MTSTLTAYATPWTPPVFEKQRVNYKIERRELSFNNDKYEVDVKTICEGSQAIDVPDLRAIPDDAMWPANPPIVCRATVDGRERDFFMYVSSFVAQPWNNIKYDTKSYGLSMWFFPVDQTPETIPQGESNSARTRQLDLRNMILDSGAPQGVSCNPNIDNQKKMTRTSQGFPSSNKGCQVVNPIVYTATAEFETL